MKRSGQVGMQRVSMRSAWMAPHVRRLPPPVCSELLRHLAPLLPQSAPPSPSPSASSLSSACSSLPASLCQAFARAAWHTDEATSASSSSSTTAFTSPSANFDEDDDPKVSVHAPRIKRSAHSQTTDLWLLVF